MINFPKHYYTVAKHSLSVNNKHGDVKYVVCCFVFKLYIPYKLPLLMSTKEMHNTALSIHECIKVNKQKNPTQVKYI